MKRAWRTWWLIYASCAAIVAVTLLVVTVAVLRLEQREFQASAEAQHFSDLRIALWRMDSWLAPQLAQEAARPYFEYAPYYAPDRAYTRLLSEIQPKEVQTPSPLLTFNSDLFPLHFQMDAGGAFTSPQVPTGNQRDLAEATLVDSGRLVAKTNLLDRLQQTVSPPVIFGCVLMGESQLAAQIDLSNQLDALPPVLPQSEDWLAQGQSGQVDSEVWNNMSRQQTLKEYAQRAQSSNVMQQSAQNMIDLLDDTVDIGPFAAGWLAIDDPSLTELSCDGSLLVFVRRVTVSGTELHQGIIADWPRIRDRLLEELTDLVADAQLQPLRDEQVTQSADGMRLAMIPVALSAPAPALPKIGLAEVTPIRATLSLVWLAAIVAVFATGITLRSSISYGERRHRFASAVTHELRTPLTTFRMYSEMLAENMVTDEARRTEYLNALRTESNRLSALVENVLAYARMEQGRAAGHLETLAGNELLDRVLPALRRRCDEAGIALEINRSDSAAATSVEVDVEAVGQILLNLIDNVCKYANGHEGAVTSVDMTQSADQLQITVSDDGPGVPIELRRTIFQPFDRGSRQSGDATPGVGLGLALSRGLARQMGGDLTVGDASSSGARFMLGLPVKQS